ncbi:PREDICTED: uncharacterized protein LOC108373464, partial [Rhagoletis zephyria]|uniref:uncharacterized protein LOC108373464 n=1 Tax=Rhagoletis zephyria TaxID=28612 RepID=UPI0008114263
MANVGGPSQNHRKLLTKVTESVMMYAAPVWGHALQQNSYVKLVNSVFRLSALRVCSAFRKVSHDAACVITGIMPADLLANEIQRTYMTARTKGNPCEHQNAPEPLITLVDGGLWKGRYDVGHVYATASPR